MLNVLIACEYSCRVRDAFISEGHLAVACDFEDPEGTIDEIDLPGIDFNYYMGDVRDILDYGWDLMIAHPPCTYISASGLHWNKKRPERAALTDKALEFVELLWNAPIERICLENPVGCINTRLPSMPKPQYVQPYDFGDDMSKKTGLWLKNLPPLVPTGPYIEPRMVSRNGRVYKRWGNQSDCGRDNTPAGPNRGKIRSRFPLGFASAMASQWG